MRQATVVVSRRRLTLASAVQFGGRAVGAFLGVLVAASLARGLTRPQFGELAVAVTILTLAGSLADLGVTPIAVREMASRPEDRSKIAGAVCATELVMGIVLGVVGLAVAFALMSGLQARIMAAFMMATMPFGAVSALTMAAQARLRAELVIVPLLVQSVVWLAAVLTLGALHAPLSLYGAAFLAARVIESAVTVALTVGVTDLVFAGARRLIGQLLRVAWPIGVAGMFVTAYYRIDAILLFHYRGATETAYYSASYRILDVLQMFPVTVGGVLLPLLASAQQEGQHVARIKYLFELAATALMAVAVPVAACGAIVAPAVISLIYGHHFHNSVYLLRILLPAFIPISLAYALTSQLILHGLLRPYIAVTVVGAVVNVTANLLAVPHYGAPAAAWATLGTEVMVLSAIAFVVHRRLGFALPAARAVRVLAATGVTAAAVWVVRAQPLVVALVIAGIVYPPCLLAARAVSVAELRALLTRQPAASA
jgi:O-antigen/teichoic acid export membrane protein